jgi:sulfite exporter TauE/SafE
MASLAGRFLVSPNPGCALVLGLGSGLLPCPIVLGFLALALQSGSAFAGLSLMAGVGLGTLLPLMVLGCFSLLALQRVRRWGSQLGAVLLVLLGLVTVLRATPFPHHLLGCPAPQNTASPVSLPAQPCCPKPDAGPK